MSCPCTFFFSLCALTVFTVSEPQLRLFSDERCSVSTSHAGEVPAVVINNAILRQVRYSLASSLLHPLLGSVYLPSNRKTARAPRPPTHTHSHTLARTAAPLLLLRRTPPPSHPAQHFRHLTSAFLRPFNKYFRVDQDAVQRPLEPYEDLAKLVPKFEEKVGQGVCLPMPNTAVLQCPGVTAVALHVGVVFPTCPCVPTPRRLF
jgi:hypothetical protein